MLPKANMTIKSVQPPTTYWCKSGHKAKEGVDFYYISGETLPKEHWGSYCDDCLKAANKRSDELKADGTLKIMKDLYGGF